MVQNTHEDSNWITKMDAFEAPFLEEKLLDEGVFSTHEEYLEAFREFKRYLVLQKLHSVPLGMTSKKVDAVWHQFILFTKDYASFCQENLGYFLHHVPRTRSRALDEQSVPNFVRAYQKTFGEIPAVWEISNKAKADCGPDPGEGDSACGCQGK